ncbi:hypothetical protein [Insolitispirillum peregrinum]|uniref:Uncharacterized protein n=1 Tax=Insolitispirillum peregrinum TaxID=80876 RepID=A0A1N7MIC2_9PROT|nr:hypothetical protein [Insolitispirillum peregrinum]SIS85701.1 hypothetical protein SAMN05421779_104134 [Insolitispirillum peregrinum]
MIRDLFKRINSFIALPVIALIFSIIAYAHNEYKDYKKSKIEELNKKLELFYYPLQAQFISSENEWNAFRRKYGNNRDAYFSSGPVDIDGKTHFLRDCAKGEAWKLAIGEGSTYNESSTKKYCIVSDIEIEAWVNHISAQYHGSEGRAEQIILENRKLISEDKEMIEYVDKLMLHFTGYRDVIARWEKGDRRIMTSHNNFPKGITKLVDERIKSIEHEIKNN